MSNDKHPDDIAEEGKGIIAAAGDMLKSVFAEDQEKEKNAPSKYAAAHPVGPSRAGTRVRMNKGTYMVQADGSLRRIWNAPDT